MTPLYKVADRKQPSLCRISLFVDELKRWLRRRIYRLAKTFRGSGAAFVCE
jgi:hypothetical protein